MDHRVDGHTIFFTGSLNETTDLNALQELLASISPDPVEGIVLDFEGVVRCNSIGILNWVKVFDTCLQKVTYKRCPVHLVEQLNVSTDFLRPNMHISSFYARFYSEHDDHFTLKLLEVGKDVPVLDDYEDFEFPDLVRDGVTYEPDFDPAEYFHFIILMNRVKEA